MNGNVARTILVPLCTVAAVLTGNVAGAAPADTNGLLEKVATENRVPPILLKAIAWQESKWTHRLANGNINVAGDGGVGIMQIQGGDRNATEEQNIRAGVAKLLVKWQLNVSADAHAAVDKLGGLPEDYQPEVLENWFVPLAGYNGYSGNATTGQGGGKGYARAIFSMVASPARYQNWRTDGHVEAVLATVQPYFFPQLQITDPRILPGFDGGTADHIQAYSLCQMIKAGGRIHRYDFATKGVSDITATIQPRCSGAVPVTGPVATVTPVMAAQIAQNQTLKFTVVTDKPADQVKITFQNPLGEVVLAGSGTQWSFERAITVAGSRPWVISVLVAGKVTDDHLRGTLAVLVNAVGPTIAGAVEAPAHLGINDEMKMLVRTAAAAGKVSIDFGSGTVFDFTPDVPRTTWTWSKAMVQAGQRDYTVKVYGQGQSQASDQRPGSVQVDAAAASAVTHPLPNHSVARILADPGYGYVFKSEHTGIDIMAPVGTAVKAMCGGSVVGNYTTREIVNAFLIIKHSCGGQVLYGYYGHIASPLALGAAVTAGASVGTVRQYGSNNHHLHFGIDTNLLSRGWGRSPLGTTRQAMLAAGWLDPLEYLKGKPGFDPSRADPFVIAATDRVTREQFGLGLLDAVPAIGARFTGTPEQRLRGAGLIHADFRGADAIIRGDAVRIAYRLLATQANLPQLMTGKALDRFNLDADLDDDTELRQQANSLAALGVVGGVPNGTLFELEPGRQLSKAEQAAIVDRTRILLGAGPVAGPKILAAPSVPASIDQNAKLTFTVNTDKPADKVVMVFQTPDGEAQLTGSGTRFDFDRAITVAGSRPWKLRVYSGSQVSDEHVKGTLVVRAAATLLPWQQAALAYANNYLEGRQQWGECWDAGLARRGTYCYKFARQAVGLPPMASAIDAFDSLLEQGRASTAGFDTAPVGSLIFYRIGNYGHVAVKVSATEVAGHGNELAFAASCPPITRVAHISLVGRAPYAGFYAAGGGAVTLDPNVIPAAQRLLRQDFLAQLKSRIHDNRLSDGFAAPLAEPTRPITRGEAALLLGRALVRLPPQMAAAAHGPLVFADAAGGELAQLLAQLSARDIVQGQANELAGGVNYFPDRQLSRTEADALLTRSSALLAAKQGPADLPPPTAQLAVAPASVAVGQAMTFTAALSNAQGVAKVELVFPAAGVTEAMTQTAGGSQWTRQRAMAAVASGAAFQVKVTMSDGRSQLAGAGSYSVVAATVAIPTAQLTASPAAVEAGQSMSFNATLSSAQGVARVDLVFPAAGVTEAMAQSNGSNSWTRLRAMTGVVSGAAFQVKVTMNDGRAQVLGSGTYSVTPPPLPTVAAKVSPASVRANQAMTFSALLSSGLGVARVDLVFPAAGVTEPMQASGATGWTRARTMTGVINGAQYLVRATMSDGRVQTASGVYTVIK